MLLKIVECCLKVVECRQALNIINHNHHDNLRSRVLNSKCLEVHRKGNADHYDYYDWL